MDKYTALDSTAWAFDQGDSVYPTSISAGAQMFEYHVTAAHKTLSKGYIDVYITKDSWQPGTVLTWNSLESAPICHWVPDTYPTPIQKGGPMEAYPCTIPDNKAGRQHVLFMVWQRDDSDEAFYSCSDVVIAGDGGDDS